MLTSEAYMSWCNFRHFSVQTAQLSSDLWPWGCLLKTRTWRFRNNPMSAKIKPSLPLKQVLEMSLRLFRTSLGSSLPLTTFLEHFFFNLSKLRLFLYSKALTSAIILHACNEAGWAGPSSALWPWLSSCLKTKFWRSFETFLIWKNYQANIHFP